MKISFEINKRFYRIDTVAPIDISIPLDFYGSQPNAYGVEKATSKPCEAGTLVGDTRRGGSCNFEQVTLIPHCNGTHTESVGHITDERISVRECLKDAFIPSVLISVKPENVDQASDTYPVKLGHNEKLITRKTLESALKKLDENFFQGLIVRTKPNDAGKLTRTYLKEIPSFFSTEAMNLMVDLGVRHLLVDLPSIDRIFDEGKLSNHRVFWNIDPDSFAKNKDSFINHTITELIFVPNEIEDGNYLLNLQIAPFTADASPSRPIIFKII